MGKIVVVRFFFLSGILKLRRLTFKFRLNPQCYDNKIEYKFYNPII